MVLTLSHQNTQNTLFLKNIRHKKKILKKSELPKLQNISIFNL